MSKIRRLIQSYSTHIAVPWRDDAAPGQRVIFCVYDESDERSLRANFDEFEIVTRDAGHGWAVFDLTNSFAQWMIGQRYANNYFKQPHLIATCIEQYLVFITNEFEAFLKENEVGSNSVVALKGVGSVFGFVKVKDVVDKLAPHVRGRLVVFFPGSYENNNYRLLDGYDGWNYLAVPITADRVY